MPVAGRCSRPRSAPSAACIEHDHLDGDSVRRHAAMTTPIVVCGAAGRMGRLLVQLTAAEPRARLIAAVEAAGHPALGRDAGEVAGIEALGVRVETAYAPPRDSVTLDFTAPAAALAHLETAAAGNELRIAPSLYPLWDKVIETTLDFSGIRLRNAVRQ